MTSWWIAAPRKGFTHRAEQQVPPGNSGAVLVDRVHMSNVVAWRDNHHKPGAPTSPYRKLTARKPL